MSSVTATSQLTARSTRKAATPACTTALRRCIERFGGDPNRVLIHGESGGGRKTSMMMAFVPAQGLFHRAVVQSGSALRMDSQERARLKARRLIEALNIPP